MRLARSTITAIALASTVLAAWASVPSSAAGAIPPLGKAHPVAFGINEDWNVRGDGLDIAAATGANLIRFPVGWQYVQPDGPESWDWSTYDRIYADAASRGMQLIFAPADSPCWAHPAIGCPGPPGGRPPDQAFLPQWNEFLRRVAARYPGLAAIEIWNEPNATPFWATQPDPARYAQLLRESYGAVKSINPAMPVLFGGLQPVRRTVPGSISFQAFLRQAHRAGAKGYYDALSFHPYPLPFSRPDYLRRVRQLIAQARAAAGKGKARRVGRHRQLQVWVTEVGVSTSGPGAVTEAEQGTRLRRIYETLRRVPRVRAVVVHRMFDVAGASEWEQGWGLIRADGQTPKPAWCEIAQDRGRDCNMP